MPRATKTQSKAQSPRARLTQSVKDLVGRQALDKWQPERTRYCVWDLRPEPNTLAPVGTRVNLVVYPLYKLELPKLDVHPILQERFAMVEDLLQELDKSAQVEHAITTHKEYSSLSADELADVDAFFKRIGKGDPSPEDKARMYADVRALRMASRADR